MPEDWEQGGFGLYLHWPFCAAKCPYCDFNSHVSANIDESRWVRAYLDEIDRYADMVPERVVQSIYFGGGTPSLMAASTVGAIIDRIQARWPMANDPEITLEANPTSIEADRFRGYRSAGVNRVSMGFQALNDADLKALGRMHSVAESLAAFEIAQNTFERVSFDLIYARQNQSLEAWETELRRAVDFAADHLSLYQLTIEQGTAFGDRYNAGRLRGLPDDDLSADMYELTQSICEDAGFYAYEVSNHAKYGQESRHNMIYWRYGDYVGIGPGAHGRLTVDRQRFATETPLAPGSWLATAGSPKAESRRHPLTGLEQAEEYLMMGLRLVDGINLRRYADLTGAPLDQATLLRLESYGLVTRGCDTLSVTPSGRMVLNGVLKELLTG